jgi:hypothetical protein
VVVEYCFNVKIHILELFVLIKRAFLLIGSEINNLMKMIGPPPSTGEMSIFGIVSVMDVGIQFPMYAILRMLIDCQQLLFKIRARSRNEHVSKSSKETFPTFRRASEKEPYCSVEAGMHWQHPTETRLALHEPSKIT